MYSYIQQIPLFHMLIICKICIITSTLWDIGKIKCINICNVFRAVCIHIYLLDTHTHRQIPKNKWIYTKIPSRKIVDDCDFLKLFFSVFSIYSIRNLKRVKPVERNVLKTSSKAIR